MGTVQFQAIPAKPFVTEGFWLIFYQSRFYVPALGRMVQADSIVPGGVQGLDRYAYVGNSPLVYVDPSGHTPVCVYGDLGGTGCLVWAGLTGVNHARGFEHLENGFSTVQIDRKSTV